MITFEDFWKYAKDLKIKNNDNFIFLKHLHFDQDGDTYYVHDVWGSGVQRQYVNIWARKVGDEEEKRIYPFFDDQIEDLDFYLKERV